MSSEIHPTKPIVVLVEPSGPINIGSIARLCANFDISELRLVSPRCDPFDLDARRMAVKGLGILQKAEKFDSLIDAVEDCSRVVATCGRIDHGGIPLNSSEEVFNWLLRTQSSDRVALVFGREDRGLTNQELQIAQRVITLKTSENYPSLNLSHAVAVVLYEFHRSQQTNSSINLFEDSHLSNRRKLTK